ncbi:ABC transporter ATP-binding protein [Pseudalkalibacillus caeni]|uniref:ABC transporter ATP-binding protein n=1 Tax=Exobacillus caeni TaxID=2574798 RepID=A0A5R9F858_9BACL|nr:energy-coupling factor transporter ATPase [Pseudalkalibacillus caeni]TLS35915.1 ABC transporter ATP-binding protein [Pseudalkalibacillus caeni]
MEILKLKNLSFSYPERDDEVLQQISFDVKKGEFLVLGGPSGCGKSTLIKLVKHDIAPAGRRKGGIIFNGKRIEDLPAEELAGEIGMVFQDPDNQIVMEEVLQELAFGLENLGYSTDYIRKRVAEMVQFFGLENLLARKTHELSGGQKQLVNLASVLLLNPKLLLLDEPTSQLDPVAAKEFITMVKRINEEFGVTILMVEHRLEELTAVADRMMLLNGGQIAYDGSPREVFFNVWDRRDEIFSAYVPSIPSLSLHLNENPEVKEIPLSVKEGRMWLSGINGFSAEQQPLPEAVNVRKVLSCDSVCFRYERKGENVLSDLNIDIYSNEIFAIVGGNGSGKSTMLKTMAGLINPQRGTIRFKNQKLKKIPKQEFHLSVAYLPQNPKLFFLHDTLEEEWSRAIERTNDENGNEKMNRITEMLGISHLAEHHPYDLSGGELQKAALACLLVSDPEVLLIDEPTKGMDPLSKQKFGELLTDLHFDGHTIVMVTHDIEFAAEYATRCMMLFNGQVASVSDPRSFFAGNTFYTTSINRLVRGSNLQEVITVKEALASWRVQASIQV